MSLQIALIHDCIFPVHAYGGTERVVWWLAKGLSELGHSVKLVCLPGSSCPFAEVNASPRPFPPKDLPPADFYHYFNTPPGEPKKPYAVTIGGNGKAGEAFFQNTVFVSRNHAQRQGAESFVYNGLDPQEYIYREEKNGSLLFLAKASWKVKNLRGAIQIARQAHRKLEVIGGSRWWCPTWRGVTYRGMLGGREKAEWISKSSGLLFPVLWDEPFGLAVIEAMVSGTPILATPFGSLPELVSDEVGRICHSYGEFEEAVLALPSISPKACRARVMEKFHYLVMAREYVKVYERILAGEKLHPGKIICPSDQGKILELKR